MVGTIALGIVGLTIVGGGIFIGFSPEFGGTHTDSDVRRYEESKNYKDGIFHNEIPVNMGMGAKNYISLTYDYFFKAKDRAPKNAPPVEKLSANQFLNENENFYFVWFGHSTILMRIDGKTILIDPMFSDVPAPHPSLGNSRYQKELPITIDELPHIDLVFISHDHYDHLDYQSIQKLKEKVDQFYVPLGIGRHLIDWGVTESAIREFDWWDEHQSEDFKFVFAPARHFSGRGPMNRFSTLWGSWVLQSKSKNIYFSGDSGYGYHFKQIGEKYAKSASPRI